MLIEVMMIKFKINVSSLATGKDYKAGQIVPSNFPNIQSLLDDGIAYIDNETTIASKASTTDSKSEILDRLYLIQDMTYNELSDLLRENDLKVSGSKEDKLQRLIDYYEGGGE